jgi:prepilin-type N-terminal cleavage/methylation domain-containing protein
VLRIRDIARRLAGRDEGVTLTELVIVMSLLSVVIIAAYLLFDAVNSMADVVDARSRATDQTRLAMDRIIREVRQGREISEGAGAFASMGANDVTFYSDIDHDDAPELVRYRLLGTKLLRSVRQPTTGVPPYEPFLAASAETTLASQMDTATTPIFAYYDRQDPPQPVASGQFGSISALEIHVRNGATVGRRTVYSDMLTWVKVRAVQNAIE